MIDGINQLPAPLFFTKRTLLTIINYYYPVLIIYLLYISHIITIYILINVFSDQKDVPTRCTLGTCLVLGGNLGGLKNRKSHGCLFQVGQKRNSWLLLDIGDFYGLW